MIRLFVAAFAGALLATGFPPFDWPLVAWLGVGVFLWLVITEESRGRATAIGYAFGLGSFSAIMWWLANVELIAFYPLILLEAGFFALAATLIHRFRTSSPVRLAIAAGGAWGLAEFARVRWPFGGFPWGTLGLSIATTPLRASAQWIGATGWSVVVASVITLAVVAVGDRSTWRPLTGAVAAVVVLAIGANLAPPVVDGDAVRVAIVQGNSPCPGSRCPNERTLIYESHLELTRHIEPGSVDLVVWPESSTGFASDPLASPEIATTIGREAERIGAPILVGGDRAAGSDSFINSNLVFGSDGKVVGEYRKTHPVPFGEFVPFRPLVDWLPALDRVPRDLVRGDGPVVFEVNGLRFASVISYEGAFARYERAAVRAGAEFLVVATNEASFGDSPASDQFLAISTVRAAELGVDIVHAAVTGKSAFVGVDGSRTGTTQLFATELTFGEITNRTGRTTLYAATGDWLQVLAMLSLGWMLVASRAGVVSPRRQG